MNYFAEHPNATLELKTKSKNIENLLNLEHKGHTVVSWSVNPQELIDIFEPGTASLEERISAAKRVAEADYRLAFHLDPLIYHENWKKNYFDLIDMIFQNIPSDKVSWISTGTFRYTPALKEYIQKSFHEEKLTRYGENATK